VNGRYFSAIFRFELAISTSNIVFMAKIRKVNLKFQISISEEHLGLSRLFNELSQIEDQNQNKSQTDLHALKRRHMLKLLYDYSADKHVAGFNAPEAVASVITPSKTQDLVLQEVIDQPVLHLTNSTPSNDTISTITKQPPPEGLSTDQSILHSLGINF
jgi:hypothetical protein